jgi:hypothetical protein
MKISWERYGIEKEEAEKQDNEWETNYKVQPQEKEKNHVK